MTEIAIAAHTSSAEEQCRRAETFLNAATPLVWLDDCLDRKGKRTHPQCEHVRKRQRWLPKRLLDTGVRGVWPCVPKLVNTSGLTTKDTEFVALSHVWGSLSQEQKDAMSTTLSTLDARQEGIRLGMMPPQYRAVVVLCRCFRFRYLWIDSLCIIQDDSADWAEESTRMASVYGSASLTIAVNTKQNLFETLFAGPEVFARSVAPSEWMEQYEKFYSQEKEIGTFAFNNFLKFLYEGGITGDRTWCLQERQLSPRMIHLLDNGVLLWECPSLMANTATPEHFSFIKRGHTAEKLCKQRRLKMAMHRKYVDYDFSGNDGGSHQNFDEHLGAWHALLRDMSYRTLSYNSDNLIAIAGIAAQVQHNTGMTYLSGVWKEDIPRGLLWARIAEEAEDTFDTESRRHPMVDLPLLCYKGHWGRFSGYQGPSWSWCSIDGPTRLIEHDNLRHDDIIVATNPDEQHGWRSMVSNVEVQRSQGSSIRKHLRMDMELQVWALPLIKRLLPLDEQSLIKVLTRAATLSKADGADYLRGILGDSEASLDFVSTFSLNREEPSLVLPLRRRSYLSVEGHLGRFQCSGKEVKLFYSLKRSKETKHPYLGYQEGTYNLYGRPLAGEEPGDRVKGAAVFDIPEECTKRNLRCLGLAEAPDRPAKYRAHPTKVCVALVLERLSDLVKDEKSSATDHVGGVDTRQTSKNFRRVGLAFLESQYSYADSRPRTWTECFGEKVHVRIF